MAYVRYAAFVKSNDKNVELIEDEGHGIFAVRAGFVTHIGFSPPVTIRLIDNHPERRKRKGIAREFTHNRHRIAC